MVLCEPILFEKDVTKDDVIPLADRAAKRKNTWANRMEARRYLEKRSTFASWHPAAFEGYLDGGFVDAESRESLLSPPSSPPVHLACSPASEAACFRGVGRAVLKEISNLKCPVVVLVGERSRHLDRLLGRCSLEYYQELSNLFPRSKFVLIPSSGHFHPQERPSEVAAEISALLGDIEGEKGGASHGGGAISSKL